VMNAFHGRTAMALYVTIVELARLDIFIKWGMIGKLWTFSTHASSPTSSSSLPLDFFAGQAIRADDYDPFPNSAKFR
jgi:hypothetical protein